MNKISVLIVTLNEEKYIKRCLESVKGFADEIVVIDQFSSDKTTKISKEYTNKIFSFCNSGLCRENINFGLTKVKNKWVLNIDADEVLTEDLKNEINKLDLMNSPFNGYCTCFRQIFLNKTIGNYNTPAISPRLYKKTSIYEKVTPHSTINVFGDVGNLKNYILHFSHPSIGIFVNKINFYSDKEVVEIALAGKKSSVIKIVLKPIKVFFDNYITMKFYKKGTVGFIYSLMWANYSFLKEVKLYWECMSEIEKNPEKNIKQYLI